MLTFTQAQLDALNQISRQRFIEEVATDLRKNKVGIAAELSHDDLMSRVRATVSCAKSFGLSNRYSLTMFTKLSFIFGPRFYKHPLVKRTLQSKNIAPQHQIDVIMERMDGIWDDVKKIDDWDIYCQEFTENV